MINFFKQQLTNFIETIGTLLLFGMWALFSGWMFIKAIYCCLFNKHRAWRILTGLDVAANAVLNDDKIQTISQRAAIARNDGKKWGCVLCKLLDRIKKNHCDESLQ